jgi:CheY-like chemotaxis protein
MNPAILVVEDDRETLQPLSQLLALKGFVVLTATDSETGLRLVHEHHPNLIITDIALPGPSGLSFIEKVRGDAAISSIPIIVISGCGPMLLVEAELAGADACLEKPIDIGLFWSVVGRFAQAPADILQDRTAGEIDRLIDEIRQSSSRDEREDYVRRLKERILKHRAKTKGCA